MEEEDGTSAVAPEPAPATVVPTNVKLTAEEAESISDHINRKAASPNDACPVCGSPNNSVLEHVYQVSPRTTVTILGGAHQPLVATACFNCGFVRFFNRLIVDAIIKAEKDAPSQPAADAEARDGG